MIRRGRVGRHPQKDRDIALSDRLEVSPIHTTVHPGSAPGLHVEASALAIWRSLTWVLSRRTLARRCCQDCALSDQNGCQIRSALALPCSPQSMHVETSKRFAAPCPSSACLLLTGLRASPSQPHPDAQGKSTAPLLCGFAA